MDRLTVRVFLKWMALFSVSLALSVLVAARIGSVGMSTGQFLRVLSGDGSDAELFHIVWSVRLPRILLSALVGGALATAGAVFQALLRNPLAEPFVLGVSSGASFGAVVA